MSQGYQDLAITRFCMYTKKLARTGVSESTQRIQKPWASVLLGIPEEFVKLGSSSQPMHSGIYTWHRNLYHSNLYQCLWHMGVPALIPPLIHGQLLARQRKALAKAKRLEESASTLRQAAAGTWKKAQQAASVAAQRAAAQYKEKNMHRVQELEQKSKQLASQAQKIRANADAEVNRAMRSLGGISTK